MIKRSLAAALVAALCCFIVPASAGTTGTLSGRVTDATGNGPIAGAKVELTSASQNATTITDASGAFTVLSLAPDSYTVSASKAGYDPQSQAGISIFADQSSTISFALHGALHEIGVVRSQSSSSLVRAGTTSDVYSVNSAGQRAAKALGGSGSLDQAYSAIASVPGVNIPSGQQGWYQSVFIRGGDYDQVAYEFDGVPVLRASDGAPIVTLSALGQQEVQVYTGGTPATSDSPGLAGYINQVIKTGTHPGYGQIDVGIGSPAFYHKLSLEVGGATPNRLFSYYIGLAGANQDYRYGSQNNAAGDPLYFYPLTVPSSNSSAYILDGSCGSGNLPVPGSPIAPCPAGTVNYGFVPAPGNSFAQSNNNDRETVANVHIGLPHRHDAARDDVQLLYVTGNIFTSYFTSANQLGIGAPGACTGIPGATGCPFLDASVAAGGGYYTGRLLQVPDPTAFTDAYLPSSPTGRPPNSLIPLNQEDGGSNGYSVIKAQYQRNFNDHSYLRAIGYGQYTNWFLNGPNSAFQLFGATLPDYEVLGHIFGGSLSYSNALSSKNLISVSMSYSTQKLQTYNATFDTVLSASPPALFENTGQFGNYNSNYAAFIGGHYQCFNWTAGPNAGLPWSCYDPAARGVTQTPATLGALPNLMPGSPPVPALGGGTANWLMTEDGHNAQVDNVTPYFSSLAATDVIKPNDRLTINAGLRVDTFKYKLNDLTAGFPARQFWFDTYNNEHCWAAGQQDVSRFSAATGLGACPAGFASRATNPFTNTTGGTTSATVFQPRIAFTYLVNPNTVLRGSYGRYARPVPTSYQQYNTYQQDLPSFLGQFSALGYTTPNHDVRPDTSDNFDFSYERRVGDFSFKASPFYRSTKNQLQFLSISSLGGILAGVNVGTLRSYGLEFSARYRDFDREGFSAQLSYTYTHTRTKYQNFSNGRNVIDVLNDSIQRYNSYTSACAPGGPPDPLTGNPTYAPSQVGLCGSNNNAVNGFATFAGVDQSGGTTVIPNIYYSKSAQPLMDRNAEYQPYDVIPSAFASAVSYAVPDVATLILNYKHKKLTVTPSVSYSDGAYYGSPLAYPGIVPQACTPPAGTPPIDTTTPTPGLYCGSGGSIFIPNPFTGGKFDAMGSLREPSQLTANLQIAYDVTPKSTLTLIATGLYNQCFQRGYAWDTSTACTYSNLPSNILPPAGNFLSTGATPKQLLYPYGVWFNNTQVGITSAKQPFNMVLNYSIKI